MSRRVDFTLSDEQLARVEQAMNHSPVLLGFLANSLQVGIDGINKAFAHVALKTPLVGDTPNT